MSLYKVFFDVKAVAKKKFASRKCIPFLHGDEARLCIPPRIYRDGNTYIVFSTPHHSPLTFKQV